MRSTHGSTFACIGVLALATTVLNPAVAQARTVNHVTLSFPITDTITDLCTFLIAVSGAISGHVQDVRDGNGNFLRVALHFTNNITFSAKGTTLVSREHVNEFDLDFQGGGAPTRIVSVGNTLHLQLPDHRLVAMEAGRISEDLQTGAVTATPNFHLSDSETQALCAAF